MSYMTVELLYLIKEHFENTVKYFLIKSVFSASVHCAYKRNWLRSN